MTGERDQSSPATTWPDEACEKVARIVAVWTGYLDKLPLYERGEFAAYTDFQAETDAVLAALGPVITEHYVPRAEHEKLRADVLALAQRWNDRLHPTSAYRCAAELRALVNGDTP